MRGLALGGFMGVGKTTVGRRLAARRGVPFVDLDALLAERFGPIPDQFAHEGEAVFRARESAALRALCDGEVRVLSTGGGAWVDPDNRRSLAACYLRVVLTATPQTLAARLGDAPGRPLWGPGASSLLASRQAAYADADAVIPTDGVSVDDVVAAVEALWR